MSGARYARIAGTGRYVPERVMTNADVEAVLGQPVDAWLRERVGIVERRVMADGETTSDLAAAAGRQALERAGIGAEELDLIIVASDTPDYLSPGTASPVQAKLGARNAATFDVSCACASWVTALDVGSKAIVADSDYRAVLVVGAYAMTRFVDWKDKYTCTLFADGAGESHFEEVEVTLEPIDFAPPAPPLHFAALFPATGCSYLCCPADWGGQIPHPSPRRQLLCNLKGEYEVTTSNGVACRFPAGSVLLLEDTTGKGHTTRITSDDDVLIVAVALAD